MAKRVWVAMSGGVDSSVAAALLKNAGYEVMGVTFLTTPQTSSGINFAQEVAQQLNIPHMVLDISKEFEKTVVNYFCQEYLSARTPNPCVICNQKIKFGLLLNHALSCGADFFATGHYAQVVYDYQSGCFLLKRGRDKRKDQSYFLFRLSQEQLSSILFPLGDMDKAEVRKKAKELNLKVFDKPGSKEICFIPHNDYKKFIKKRFPDLKQKGPILSPEGEFLGEHEGIFSLTIGQRKGLKIAKGTPLYVISLDKTTNTAIVGTKDKIFRSELIVKQLNWIGIRKLEKPMEVKVQIRSQHRESPARIIPLSEHRVKVEFFEPQLAVTPGQAAVFYQADTVIGGGEIE